MYVNKYISILEKCWKQVTTRGPQSSGVLIPYFEGEAGVGKTSIVKMFSRENDLELYTMNLAVADPTDLTGIPYQMAGIMYYSKPQFLNMERGVLFFDELNRVTSPEMKAGLLSLFVDRKINGHALSPDVMLVAAGNTNSDNYETVDFDAAFTDRIVKYTFEISWNEWLDYMNLVHEESPLLSYYSFAGKKALSAYSYRRLEFVLNHYEVNNDVDFIASALSPMIAKGFLEFVDNKAYSFDDILMGRPKPKEIEPPTEKRILVDFLAAALEPDRPPFPATSVGVWYEFLSNCRAENIQFISKEILTACIHDPDRFGVFKDYCREHKLLRPIKEEIEAAKYSTFKGRL